MRSLKGRVFLLFWGIRTRYFAQMDFIACVPLPWNRLTTYYLLVPKWVFENCWKTWFLRIFHSHRKGERRNADNSVQRSHMYRISIQAIWDVIWSQTNPFLILDRPPNTLSRKDRLSKKIIFSWFWLSQKAFYSTSKVLSKESYPQVKKLEIFFANSISASSHQILMTSIWKSIYFDRSKRL